MRQSTYDNVLKVQELVKKDPTLGISRAIEIVGIANPTYYIAKRKIEAGERPKTDTSENRTEAQIKDAERKRKAREAARRSYKLKKNKSPEMVTIPVSEGPVVGNIVCLIGSPDMVLKTIERFVR